MKRPLQHTLASLLRLNRDASPAVRALKLAGAAYVLSGLAHGLVWLADGAPSLDGPVSWRKPIVFGLSGGVATLSLAWLASWVSAATTRARWTWVYVVTMTGELLLIDGQRWRGVASHFNLSTPLDTAVFAAMGVLICVAMFAAWRLGVALAASVDSPVDVRAAGAWAIRFLMLGAFIGLAMAVYGVVAQAAGGTPSALSGAGSLKLVHALALHGLQVFPALLLPLSGLGLDAAGRARRLDLAALGYALLFVATAAQALLGRAPVDPAPSSALIASAGLACLAAALRPHAPRVAAARAP
ncbi:MAG: hypothetical protein INH41_22735 [Myxococcaceae bacterium]|jgi:hypothetical protein|nr:hypothetical protein [Myxococcaceae bacterium]MCA3015215.1 hypothetical protein [Myxococcaceae bacterium]